MKVNNNKDGIDRQSLSNFGHQDIPTIITPNLPMSFVIRTRKSPFDSIMKTHQVKKPRIEEENGWSQ